MSTLIYALFETDKARYVGPHRWQITLPARTLRRLLQPRAYTRWVEQVFTDISTCTLVLHSTGGLFAHRLHHQCRFRDRE